MNPEHLIYLKNPKTKKSLKLTTEELINGKVKTGFLFDDTTKEKFPIINFIPRFVPLDNYANNFGLEWNKHDRTQYDKTSGFNISQERYENETKWGYELKGELILEAGSGSGRFTEHLVKTKGMVISFDYSNAVEANYRSNGKSDNLLIVQASIYDMPFDEETFNRVLCIGVLQHTPDPRLSFQTLLKMLKRGGHICTDIYLKNFAKFYLTPKYLIHYYTKKMDPAKLYRRTEMYINFMWPFARLLMKIPKIGKMINWRLMIADYHHLLPNADSKTLKEWAILDTYDMVSPAHDHPATLKQYKGWHETEELISIDVHYGYNGIEGRAVKA
jgi:ubiquinone/menaquinone biosynthesis C-methylase UbiE